MNSAIRSVRAMEILDSRGSPTLRVSVHLHSGIIGTSSVPSGASTGEHEAVELQRAREAVHVGTEADSLYDARHPRLHAARAHQPYPASSTRSQST